MAVWIIENIYYFLIVFAVLHLIDEYVYPGGFGKEFKALTGSFGLAINNIQIVIVNVLFISLCLFAVFYGKVYPLIGMTALLLVMLNGVLHILTGIRLKKYFPGVITGAVLYLPLGIFALAFMPLDFKGKAIALFLAGVLHLVPLVMLFLRKDLFKRIDTAHNVKGFRYFIMGLRIVLGLAFILPSIPKLMGQPFTVLGTDSPIGLFFDCMQGATIYWHFLGVVQLLTGIFLFIPRLQTLGAMLFTGLMLNIFLITLSLSFQGTTYVTFLMLCAGVVLVLWDYNKIKYIFLDT